MQAQKTVLPNGLTVVYLQLPTSQKSQLILDVPVGALHDPRHRPGLSHILEHTVFCGTESTNEKELLHSIRAAGGDYGAYTGADTTSYELSASTRDPDNFTFISDVMRQIITEPKFDEDRVKTETNIIINERADEIDNLSRHPAKELTKAIHDGTQRYADIMGTYESIRSTTGADLKQFMAEHYDAGHMTLYAVSSLDYNSAIMTLEQTVGAIPNLQKARLPEFNIQSKTADIRHERNDLLQNYSAFMFVLPKAKSVRESIIHNEAIAHLSSIIPETLRSNYGCFYQMDLGGWQSNSSIVVNYLTMSNTPEDSRQACIGIAEFAQTIDTELSDGVIEGSLNNYLDYLSNPDQINSGVIWQVKGHHNYFGQLFDREKTIEIVKSIQPDEIRERARQILQSLTGMYVQGPDPDIMPALHELQAAIGCDHSPIAPGISHAEERLDFEHP